MTESNKSKNDIPVEASVPVGMVPLEAILCTEELQGRPWRAPDYTKENRALVALVSALADSPRTIFQTLAETILDITQADSAGLSLLTRDGKTPDVCGERFYWPAIAGMWNPHVGGGTPRNFGPCGDVLDQNRTLLFRHFERRYPYLMPVIPAAEECLLVPFYVAGKAVGTIWSIMHSDRRKFDAEDDRVMASLGKFASSAYQALKHIEDLKIQVAERQKAEAEVRELAKGLEAKIRRLVEANVVGILMWNLEGAITGANEAFLRMVQYDREDLASGRVRWTDLTPAEWRDRDERAIAELKTTGIFQPFEKEFFRKDGSRVPILLGGALFEGSGNEGVAFVLDLTEQKLKDSARRYSEERYRVVVETASDAVVSIDDKGSIVFANPATSAVFGYDPTELTGKPLTVLMPEYMRELHQGGFKRYLATGERHINWQGTEMTALRKNGKEFPVEVSFGELVKDGHKIFTGILRDISKRKQAEDGLRAAINERTRLSAVRAEIGMALTREGSLREVLQACAKALVQHLDAAFARIWTLSDDGTELELQASAGMYTRLGGRYSRIPLGKFKIGHIAEARKAHVSNDLQNDPEIKDKDWARAEKMTSFVGYPLVVEGRTVGVMGMFSQKPIPESILDTLSFLGDGIAQGIDRKRAEEELRRSEAFLAEAQHLSQIGSYSWRVAADKITWSEQLYRIYELESGVPVTLELILTRVHPDDLTLYEKMVEQARTGGKDFEWQYRLLMPDHSIKYLHAVAHATRDQDGQLEYIAAIQDVTARRRSEEALDKARSQLASVARATSLGVLTASIAHELNQPLSGIVTNASTCLRMLGPEPPNVDGARETARRTIRDANRASEVITRLRALYGKKESIIESVDLNEAAREVVALSLNELQRNRVILRSELADDLPLVAGDRVQLQQVILNLLRNACDAMGDVEDRTRGLVIRTERNEDGGVRLSVKDAGVGFDPQAVERLFDAFYTTKSDGMGIGLSVSHSIIKAHQGRLWATPNDGPGATFSFAIPCGFNALAGSETRVDETKSTADTG